MNPSPHDTPIAAGNQRGGVIILVLLVVFAVLSLGVVGSRNAWIEMKIARHDVFEKKALAVAEGGLNHVLALLEPIAPAGFDDELADAGTGGVLADLGTAATHDGVSYRFRSYGGIGGPDDGYYVRVEDNWDETTGSNDPTTDVDGTLRVISIGRIGSAERQIEGTLGLSSGPDCALTVQGNLEISGNPPVSGAGGCVHTNQNLVNISGNPIIEVAATASGTMDISGSPTIAGESLNTESKKNAYEATHAGQPAMTIPSVCPLQFGPNGLNLANEARAAGGYLLSQDGKIYDNTADWSCSPSNTGGNPCTISESSCGPTSGTACVHDGGGGSAWNGWKWGEDSSASPGAKWVYETAGTGGFDGVFFVEGWVDVAADAGTSSNRWEVAIIAMNSISISSNPYMAPRLTSGNLRNVMLVSGNDLGIGGNAATADRPAASFAHREIKLNGNAIYHGFFVAENGATLCSPEVAPTAASKENIVDFNYVSGDPVISFSGDLETALFPPTLELVSWNDVRED